MQVITVIDAGKRIISTPITTESGVVDVESTVYFLNGSPETSAEWSGDVLQVEPFGMGSPWDYIFKSLIDTYGASFIGKVVTLDVDDVDGNILKVR